MNEEYLQNIYNALGLEGRGVAYGKFKNTVSSNQQYNDSIYNALVQQTGKEYNRENFQFATGLKKKDEQQQIQVESTILDSLSASGQGNSAFDWASVTNPSVRTETNAIGGSFGQQIESLPFGIGDLIDDSYRAMARGSAASMPIPDALDIMGVGVNEESFNNFYDSYTEYLRTRDSLGESDEMKAFNAAVAEDPNFGWFTGIVKNPSVVSEMLFEAYNTMANESALSTAGAIVTGAFAAGATVGSVATPLGSVVGGLTTAAASIPYAIGAASAVTSTAQFFGQAIENELNDRGLEWNKDNVRAVMEDEDFMTSTRNTAIAAGAAVGVIDGVTMKLGASVGARILTAGGKYSKLWGTMATTAVESAGGIVSQSAEMGITGQPITASSLATGMVAGNVTTPITVGMAFRNSGKYYINNQRVTAAELQKFLDTATDEQVKATNIEVKNDDKMSNALDSRTKDATALDNLSQAMREFMTPEEIAEYKRLNSLIGSSEIGLEPKEKLVEQLNSFIDGVRSRASEALAESELETLQPQQVPTETPEPQVAPQRDPRLRPAQEPTTVLGKLFKRKNRDITLNGQVYDSRSRFRKLRRFWNNTFKSNAGIDSGNAEILRGLNRDVAAFTDALKTEQNAFLNVMKQMQKNKKRDYDSDLLALNDYLNGDQEVDISFLTPEQKQVIDYARNKIDSLSDKLIDILMQDLGSTDAQIEARLNLIKTIEENKGSYMRRTYQIFTDSEYLDGLTVPYADMSKEAKARYDEAVEFVMTTKENMSRAEAESQIVAYLDNIKRNKDSAELALGMAGSAYAPFLKGRKDVPEPIRKLLGEAKDPLYNYINTAYKIENYIANVEYQRQLSTSLIESGIGVPADQARAGYTRFAPESEAWSHLHDIFVPEEFKVAFEEIAPTPRTNSSAYEFFVKMSSYAKLGKTVLSPTTTMRNLYSGVFLGLNSGHMFALTPDKIGDYIGKAWGTEKLGDVELRAERDRLIRLGVLADGARAGEITAMMNDFSTDVSRASGAKSAGMTALQAVQKAYAFGDDFYKVAGFYQEKQGFIRSGMTEAEAEVKAAERIRNSYPTYSYVSPNIRKLRRFPLSGTFVSFPYEVVRTTKNNLMFAIEDINAGRTQMGMRRLAGMVAANGTLFALSEYSKNLVGLDDEDDETIRTLVPDYQENSELIFIGSDNEGARFIDGTALFPTEVVHQPIRILMENPNDEATQQRAIDAFMNLAGPYVGVDLTAKTISELANNEDSFGRKIYEEGQERTDFPLLNGIGNDPTGVLDYLAEQAGPGVYKNIQELMRSLEVNPEVFGEKYSTYREYTPEDALMGLLGFRITTVDYDKAIANKVRGENQKLNEMTNNQLSKISYQRPMTREEVEKVAQSYIENNVRLNQLMQGYVSTGRKLGLDDENIVQAILFGGVSKAVGRNIMSEEAVPVKPITRERVKSKLEYVSFTAQEDKRDEFMNVYMDNITIFNQIIDEYNESIKQNR